MDIATIWTIIGTGIAVVAFVYTFLRNFKMDLSDKIDRFRNELNERIDKNDAKLDAIQHTVNDLDKRLYELKQFSI